MPTTARNINGSLKNKYSYDYENRLTEITKPDGPDEGSDPDPVASYTYDALGRRIEFVDNISNVTTRFYYDGWRVLTETDESDNIEREFIYGNYLDEVLVKVESSQDIYYTHDHLYSPVALLDSSGSVIERYEYDAYGKCNIFDDEFTPRSSSNYNNSRLFTGQMLDTLDSGDLLIMYYKNRYYLVDLGRFVQPDPLGVRDEIFLIEYNDTGVPVFPRNLAPDLQYKDGMNFYEYVKSHPSISFDPKGTDVPSMYPQVKDIISGGPEGSLMAICDKYKCACGGCNSKQQCRSEAKKLFKRYKTKLKDFIKKKIDDPKTKTVWGRKYIQCDEYSCAIMGMSLTAGLKCFHLREGWEDGKLFDHQFVGVFHACNSSDCSDRTLDPWSIGDLSRGPRVTAGRCKKKGVTNWLDEFEKPIQPPKND